MLSENKKIVVDYMDRLWNQKDISVIDEVFAPQAQLRSPLGAFFSPEGMKEIVNTWLNRVPDISITQQHLVEDHDIVTSHWQANSSSIDYRGVTIHRLQNGKIVEYWAYTDRVEI